MTAIFDQFSLLDPQRAQRQLETQQGKQVFDQFGTLDPARAQRQVEAALDKPVFDRFSMYDSDRALRQIEAAAGGGGGYVAPAVHFDGTAYLRNGSFVGGDGNYLSFSWWCKVAPCASPTNNVPVQFVIDPENNYTSLANVETTVSGTPDVQFMQLGNITGSKYVTFYSVVIVDDLQWHHVLFSGQTNLASGNNVCKMFIDGVDTGSVTSDQGPYGMFFNGLSFWFGHDGYNPDNRFVGDFADPWIAPNVNLIDGSGTIPPTTIALFRDPVTGKPVNPSGFPSSGVLFSGDATGFPINQGTGGSFTLTGTLTDAGTSPSD